MFFQTYVQVVIAETNYGNVSVSSDGVTVFGDGSLLNSVMIRDGPALNLRIRKGLQLLYYVYAIFGIAAHPFQFEIDE